MLLTALLGSIALATATIVEEPRLTNGWSTLESAATLMGATEDMAVEFVVQAKERNMVTVEEIARAVSDPASPSYGQYLKQHEIDELTAPAPADLAGIRTWLDSFPDCQVSVQKSRLFTVSCTKATAESMLETKFRMLHNPETRQTAMRAGAYTIPSAVAASISSVWGLHGLPLPPKKAAAPPAPPAQPAAVTPAVIESQYSVSGVTVDRSGSNLQAVAEFQGQTMNETDLEYFFSKFVPSAKKGDDKVSKFVGDPGDKSAQTEASLDIQFMMGVTPGIKTEFWLFSGQDFCKDLKNWTNMMLSDDNVPLVHSVSYGWQGNLTTIGCTDDNKDATDADFAKLAAKGITIIFASGDSGSGYAPPRPNCNLLTKDTVWTGTVAHKLPGIPNAQECCMFAGQGGAGFSFAMDPDDDSEVAGQAGQFQCKDMDNTQLTGEKYLSLHVAGSIAKQICCEFSNQHGVGYTLTNSTTKDSNGNDQMLCTVFKTVTGHSKSKSANSATNPRAKTGTCTVFSSITGKTTVKNATSGKAAAGAVELWPSWPASSPYVTAVGATRFQGQKAGNPEMATDQFGSGGGFSNGFPQSPNAKWQSADVANYLKVVPKGAPFPPAGSFPPLGRATPDVSALGEGFQVVGNGHIQPVGGTSASAPTFAGIVSLLNEARLQKKMKPLGLLNPWLYKNADAFTDVTVGTNAIGRGNGPIRYGFNCTKGWDPATGLGTPHFGKLLTAATAGN